MTEIFTKELAYLFLKVLKLPLVQLYPLIRVANRSILQQGSKHHEETESQIDVQSFHIRNLWQ